MSSNLEAAAISKFRAYREEQFVALKQRKDTLAAQLQAVVPESFKKWLVEAGGQVIENLFEYGSASHKYRRDGNDGLIHGYTDLNEFERRFNELKAAWSGAVDISINWDGDYRFEVIFKAV